MDDPAVVCTSGFLEDMNEVALGTNLGPWGARQALRVSKTPPGIMTDPTPDELIYKVPLDDLMNELAEELTTGFFQVLGPCGAHQPKT